MTFNTGDIYLHDMLQNYEHTVMLHTEKWQAYKNDIDQFEKDITDIGQLEAEMPIHVKKVYQELQQMLAHMKQDEQDLKQQIEVCYEKIERLKRCQ